MLPRPELTAAERAFLQAWIWEEAHPRTPPGETAKRTQVEKAPRAAPLLADIAAAALSSEEQIAAASSLTLPGNPSWPWPTEEDLRARHREARTWLEHRRRRDRPLSSPNPEPAQT